MKALTATPYPEYGLLISGHFSHPGTIPRETTGAAEPKKSFQRPIRPKTVPDLRLCFGRRVSTPDDARTTPEDMRRVEGGDPRSWALVMMLARPRR